MSATDSTQADRARKSFGTLRAEAALAGIALVEGTDDRDRRVYHLSKWGLFKTLDSLDEVARWLLQVTGRQL